MPPQQIILIRYGIDWLEFNGTFSTVRVYRAFRRYSLVYDLENGSTLGVLYISYSVVDDQQHKEPPRIAFC